MLWILLQKFKILNSKLFSCQLTVIYNFNKIKIACIRENSCLCQDNYTPDSFYSLDSTKTSCYNIVKSEKLKYDGIMFRLIEGGIGSVLGVFGIPLLQMKTNWIWKTIL